MSALTNGGVTRLVRDLRARFAAKAHAHSASDITSGSLSVLRGGTGVDVWEPGRVLIGGLYRDGIDFMTPAAGALYAPSATDVPLFGTLPVAQGGTGQVGVTTDSVVGNIANAGTGCEVTNAQFCQWGKVAQLFLSVKCTTAKSSGNVIAWLYSGKLPCTTSPLMNISNPSQNCAAYPNGEVQAKGSIPAGTTVYVVGTYLLK